MMVYTTSLHAVGRDGGNTSFTTGLCTDQLYPGQSVCVCVLMICLAIYRLHKYCLQSSKKRRKEAKAKEKLPLQGRSGHSASPPPPPLFSPTITHYCQFLSPILYIYRLQYDTKSNWSQNWYLLWSNLKNFSFSSQKNQRFYTIFCVLFAHYCVCCTGESDGDI